jgi:hypothetical protein
MTCKLSIPTILSMLLIFGSCSSQETAKEQPATPSKEAVKQQTHSYGGWYCPDNFGFVPVDIQKLSEVPAIANRLPTDQELTDHKSLIKVDTALYPDARALKMNLPRVASIYSEYKGMSELSYRHSGHCGGRRYRCRLSFYERWKWLCTVERG